MSSAFLQTQDQDYKALVLRGIIYRRSEMAVFTGKGGGQEEHGKWIH